MRAIVLALTLPVLAGTLASALYAALEWAGVSPPLSVAAPRNIAEAAGMGSAADVQRYLDAGDDPAREHTIAPEIISPSITRVTALEAAIWSRRIELVQFLGTRQAFRDAAARARLACLAQELRVEDISEYLAADAAVECSGSVIERIAARTH